MIILSGNYRLPLTVGPFIALAHSAVHLRARRSIWEMTKYSCLLKKLVFIGLITVVFKRTTARKKTKKRKRKPCYHFVHHVIRHDSVSQSFVSEIRNTSLNDRGYFLRNASLGDFVVVRTSYSVLNTNPDSTV